LAFKAKEFSANGLRIIKITHGRISTNSYIIYGEDKSAIIIDPGEDDAPLEDFVGKEGLNVKLIALTHGHFDHACSAGHASDLYSAPIAMSSKDEFLLDLNRKAMESLGIMGIDCSFRPDIDLSDVEEISAGNGFSLGVLKTPGHTPGSVTFFINGKIAFTGDTLFSGFIGRTDFPGGSYDEIVKSLELLLKTLEDDTLVLPGHGEETTMGRERAWIEKMLNERGIRKNG